MNKLYRFIGVGVMLVFALCAQAQNNTSSPFSCLGLGDVNDNVPNTFRAMGGVGVGMRNHKVLCPSQPAAYTAMDSLTFMFDIAASVLWTQYRDDAGMRNKVNGNLEYLAIQFPLYKRYVSFSAGVMPYTSVGYDLHLTDSVPSNDPSYHYTMNYIGNGGVSQIYAGVGVNLFDWVSLGFNVYYMFGEVTNSKSVVFAETGPSAIIQASSTTVSTVRFREGLQVFHTFGDHDVTLGAIFETSRPLNGTSIAAESSQLDTVYKVYDVGQTPMMFGVGASYCWRKRLTLAFDYSRSYWSQINRYGSDGEGGTYEIIDPLKDRNKYAFGVEYCNDPMGRRYVDRMCWRVGANVSDSYLAAMSAPDYMVSMGFGFPLRNSGTTLNLTVEYGHRGQIASLREDYIRVTFNAAVCENWFMKRKL